MIRTFVRGFGSNEGQAAHCPVLIRTKGPERPELALFLGITNVRSTLVPDGKGEIPPARSGFLAVSAAVGPFSLVALWLSPTILQAQIAPRLGP